MHDAVSLPSSHSKQRTRAPVRRENVSFPAAGIGLAHWPEQLGAKSLFVFRVYIPAQYRIAPGLIIKLIPGCDSRDSSCRRRNMFSLSYTQTSTRSAVSLSFLNHEKVFASFSFNPLYYLYALYTDRGASGMCPLIKTFPPPGRRPPRFRSPTLRSASAPTHSLRAKMRFPYLSRF